MMQVFYHLDVDSSVHHDVSMRTTVTLDKDVVRMLQDATHHSRRSFKETLNAAIRAGLAVKPARTKRARFVVKARPLGLRAGIDPTSFNKLVDDLEADAIVNKVRKTKRR